MIHGNQENLFGWTIRMQREITRLFVKNAELISAVAFLKNGKSEVPPHHWTGLLGTVRVKPTPGLFTNPPGINHLTQQWSRAVLCISELLVEHSHDCQASIQSDKVCECERALCIATTMRFFVVVFQLKETNHWIIRAEFHRRINIFSRGNALLKNVNGLVNVGHKNSVRDESRNVLGASRCFAHECSQSKGFFKCGIIRCQTANNFNEFHDGNRIHKMHANDLMRAFCCSSNFGNGN